MPEKESKIIFLTSGYEEHPAMRTDEEMKDCKVEEWPDSFKEPFEKLKKAIGNWYITLNPLVCAASDAAFENEKIRRSSGDEVYNEAVNLCQTTANDFKTCLRICQARRADKLLKELRNRALKTKNKGWRIMSSNETDSEARRQLVNNVYGGYPSIEAKTLAEKLEELEEEKRKLVEDINNQPLINIIPRGKKSKEGKLPRKLRKGW